MAKLPMRPIKFIVIYLLVSFFAIVSQKFGGAFGLYAGLILGLAAGSLHLAWTFQSLRFASTFSAPTGASETTQIRAAFRSSGFAAALTAFVVIYDKFLESYIPSNIAQVFGVLIIFSAFFFLLRVFWIAASTLCAAEQKETPDAHSVIGTFLLFFYLLIGAPFIFRRLRAIAEPHQPAPTMQTAT